MAVLVMVRAVAMRRARGSLAMVGVNVGEVVRVGHE